MIPAKPRSMFRVIVIMSTINIGTMSYAEHCESPEAAYVYLGASHSVVQWLPTTDESITVWQSDHWVTAVKESSKGLVAFLERLDNEQQLRVLNIEEITGGVIAGPVHTFCWSPEGDCLAYGLGSTDEEAMYGYASKGVYVFDLDSKQREKILPEGYRLYWAEFDGRLYYEQESGVHAWQPSTGQTMKTPYLSTNFSPQGTYYYVAGGIDWPAEIYLRKAHKKLSCTETSPIDMRFLWRLGLGPWATNTLLMGSGRIIPPGATSTPDYIIDVTTGVVRQAKGKVVCGYDSKAVVVRTDKEQYALESLESMERVTPEVLPGHPSEPSGALSEVDSG